MFQLRKWYRVLKILRNHILTSCDILLTRQGNFLSILFFSVVSLVHELANKVVVCPHCQMNYLVLVQVIIKQHTLTTANRLSFHFRYEVLNKGRAWLYCWLLHNMVTKLQNLIKRCPQKMSCFTTKCLLKGMLNKRFSMFILSIPLRLTY